MPTILIADPFDEAIKTDFMQKWGGKNYIVIHKPTLKGRELAEELATGRYDTLIVGSKDIDAPILQAWRQASKDKPLILVRSGSDFSHIAIGAAAESGIRVMNTPGANKEVIASYVLNRLPADGKGQTLAVIGYGEIGKDVVKYAHSRGFTVKVFSPHAASHPAEGSFTAAASPQEALQNADYVSITTPLITREEAEKVNLASGRKLVTPSFHSIDAQALAGLNQGAHIILPSRPDVIDMTALASAVRSGKVAKLHVNTTNNDITALKTQHPFIAAFGDIQPSSNFLTIESKRNMAIQACERVVNFFEHGMMKNTIIPALPSIPLAPPSPAPAFLSKTATILAHPTKSVSEQRINPLFDESNIKSESISTEHAKVILTYEQESTAANYAYSGIRVLAPMSDEQAVQNAKRLSLTSSSWKNWLINHAIKDRALATISEAAQQTLPQSVTQATSREIYGGRAIIIPRSAAIQDILNDPTHHAFKEFSTPLYQAMGRRLNELGGRLKVTPDFGPNASTADKMHDYTPHVLGISKERNGSGGKSEYSITSILTAIKRLGLESATKDSPITVIGSAGALGTGVCGYLHKQGFSNVTLCDLQYNSKAPAQLPDGWKLAKAEAGKFTDECLARSGKGSWIITTAYGDEMIHSNWQQIKAGTTWLGAQNKDLPERQEGIDFARKLRDQGVTHIPGQVLTIGGTVASWVEWRARQEAKPYDKAAAHEVVEKISGALVSSMISHSQARQTTSYEAMLNYAHKSHWQEKSHVNALAQKAPTAQIRSKL